MPSSFHGHISDVIDIYLKANPLTVLDVGVGYGKWGTLFREYGDVFKGRLKPEEWRVSIHGVEIFENYYNLNYDQSYTQVFFESIVDFLNKGHNIPEYDFIYAGDVIEHLDKKTALNVINKFKIISKTLAISIPLTDRWPQGEIFGNEHEAHKSIWEEKDFTGLFANKKIYTNPAGKLIGLFYG